MRASESTTALGRLPAHRAPAPLTAGYRGSEAVPAVTATDSRLLLSSIVHDFNNLLTPIVTILEELQARHVGTSRQLKKIDGAIYCAFRAKVLARQLLDFANPRPASPEPVQIRQLLEPLETALASVLSPGTCGRAAMTIERQDGLMQIVCECGIAQVETYDPSDFDVMISDAKAEGFVIQKIDGEWRHTCPVCVDAARRQRSGGRR